MRFAGLILAALLGVPGVALAVCPGTSTDCPPLSTSQINLGGSIVGPTGVPFVPPNALPSAGQVLTATDSNGHTAWQAGGTGSVTQVTVAPGNGFTGSVATANSTPAITLGTTVSGLLKGNGTGVSAATAGTDYLAPNSSGAALTGLTWGQIGSTPTTLGGYGITNGLATTNNLSDLANAATARTNLNLGTMATQSAGAVAVTGGSISGLSSMGVAGTFNGWTPTLGVSDLSPQTPASGGSGNAVGDTLTLNDGCATHATLGIYAVSSGAVTTYIPLNRGSCLTAPSNPVSVLSSTGAGTGATFNLIYAPLAAGLTYQPTSYVGGNLFLGTGPSPGFAGSETTLGGVNAGSKLTGVSNFVTAFGLSSCGGAAAAPFQMSSSTCFGTDAGRNLSGTGTNAIDAFGSGALATQSLAITLVSAFGHGTFGNLNVEAQPANLAGFGPVACPGSSSVTPTFNNGTCAGTQIGSQLRGLSQFLLLGNVVGNTTLTDGNGVILIGSGQAPVDAPTALVRHWMNIENSLIVTTMLPTITSGFGTSPSVVAGKGSSSAGFQVNVGAGGTASSGVINITTHSVTNSNSPTGWICNGYDKTNSASSYEAFVSNDDGQTVTVTNYSRTTGAATAWTAGDVLEVSCNGY